MLRHAAACFYLHMWVPTLLWQIELTCKRRRAQHWWPELITAACCGMLRLHLLGCACKKEGVEGVRELVEKRDLICLSKPLGEPFKETAPGSSILTSLTSGIGSKKGRRKEAQIRRDCKAKRVQEQNRLNSGR